MAASRERSARRLSRAGRLPRRVALLGGTTTWLDCAVALRHLIDRQNLVEGAAIAEFERAFAAHIGVRHAFSFSAGRVGLHGLLLALGVGEGDEVLTPVPTHVVVPNAVRYTGARPVFVDCEPGRWVMDIAAAERAVTPRTKVLLLQHTFGIPGDIDAALRLAERHGFLVIEDCVHALGAEYRGRQVGSFGAAAFFSTEETKTISSTMGGVVVSDDDRIADSMRVFQSRCAWPSSGLARRYLLKLILYHLTTQPQVGWYSRKLYSILRDRDPLPQPTDDAEKRGERPAAYEQRLSNAQAVLAHRQLARLDTNVAHRRGIAAAYRSRLSGTGLGEPPVAESADPTLLRYPVWVEHREAVIEQLEDVLGVGTWFTSVLEEADDPAFGGYVQGTCPIAESAARHLVNLPTHPRVSLKDVQWIVGALLEAAVDADAPAQDPVGARA